jgi:hypothetical protein
MYFFEEIKEDKSFYKNGIFTTTSQQYERQRLEYNTIKKYISQILKSVEQNKINTKDIKVFNERISILNSLINENIELDIGWIKQMIKEMLPKDENYKISILSTYIFDLLFHITREKIYIERQFESEWDYPGGIYEIEDPKILQLEKENQELKKKINELLSRR